jgi:Ca2+-binding RTX toxin-like protein
MSCRTWSGSAATTVFVMASVGVQAHSSGAPAQTCWGRKATIVGTPGNNVLIGTRGRDVIVGLEGNDTIKGHGGNDVICGDNGADKIVGGKGVDLIGGGRGDGRLYGNVGKTSCEAAQTGTGS